MPGFPLDDPQFWLVTAATAGVVAWAIRRLRRSIRRPPDSACSNCPAATGGKQRDGRSGGRAVGVVLLALATASAAQARPGVERLVTAMGTELRVAIEGLERAEALALAEEMIRAVERTERQLSTWREDSELALLNREPVGTPVTLSPGTWRALAAALRCARASGGAFDPTVGSLVRAWDLRGDGRVPSENELAVARRRVGPAGLRLERPSFTATRVADVEIEEGGFGKGAALEAALEVAGERAPAAAVTLDFGGQLAWRGRHEGMRLNVADPRDRARTVLELDVALDEGSVATSSDSERSRQVDGIRVGHLLDPRSGRPAPEFGSATSIEPRAALADCRSTALYVLGPVAARERWSAGSALGEGLLLVIEGESLRALAPETLRGRVRALVPDLELELVERGAP